MSENSRESVAMIPYYVHEGEMNRMERVIKKLWIALLVLFLAFVGTNLGWILYENSFTDEIVTETYTATADDNSNAIMNGEGQVNIYGSDGGLYQDNAPEGAQGQHQ